MDKLEYIPGDFISVYVGVKKYIVEVIGTENENEVLSYKIKFPNGEIQYADKGNIVPIPLTPEILKKNGWKPTKESLGHSFKNKEYPRFALWSINDKWSFTIDGVMVCNTLSCLCYVHELQHLLFGLGLNSEMEV